MTYHFAKIKKKRRDFCSSNLLLNCFFIMKNIYIKILRAKFDSTISKKNPTLFQGHLGDDVGEGGVKNVHQQ